MTALQSLQAKPVALSALAADEKALPHEEKAALQKSAAAVKELVTIIGV